MNESGCDFCDKSKLEERIIVETGDCYVVASLGQITDGGYVLVIPKAHVVCTAALSHNTAISVTQIARKAMEAISEEYMVRDRCLYPITFEHGIIGQTIRHAHWHILPAAMDLTPQVRASFPGHVIEETVSVQHLLAAYNEKCGHQRSHIPYLFWTDTDGYAMTCWDPPAPAQYFRNVIAKLLQCPERASWRNMDPVLDKKLWSETVTRLKPYFS